MTTKEMHRLTDMSEAISGEVRELIAGMGAEEKKVFLEMFELDMQEVHLANKYESILD